MNSSAYLVFKQISKKYGERLVLDAVSLEVHKGQVVAILGENGAGKSTLMNILGGLTTPQAGQIYLNSQAYSPQSASHAFSHNIGFVHQHFLLANNLTALENLLLMQSTQLSSTDRTDKSAGQPINQSIRLLDTENFIKKINDLLKRFSWSIDLDRPVHQLSVGDQQRIEILKSLLQNPDLLILDEPTAVLSPIEVEKFLQFILLLKQWGKTVLLVTHKISEVEKVADQVIILRNGKLVHNSQLSQTTPDEMSKKIVGDLFLNLDGSAQTVQEASSRKILQLPNSQIDLQTGEIFGVAGVDGNGQTELIQNVLNLLRQSNIKFGDISEDRFKKGIFPEFSLEKHMVLRHRQVFTRAGFILAKLVHQQTEKVLQDWDVRPLLPTIAIKNLSGGNQQKFVVGRELWHNPDFVIAAHPTRGVDIGAQQKIHQAFLKLKENSKTVFLVSSDLDEVLKLSDRYIILYKGQIHGPYLKKQLSELEIGQLMTGAK